MIDVKNTETEELRDILREVNEELNKRDHIYASYPNIEKDTQEFIDRFKNKLKMASTEVLDEVYCGIGKYAELDTLSNMEEDILSGLRSNYPSNRTRRKYDYKKIRGLMLLEHKDLIVEDINQDLLREVERLREEWQKERNRNFGL